MKSSEETASPLDVFAEGLLELPWGSLSKSELEFRVFQFLADTGKVKLDRTDVQLAQDLATTLTKVRTLRYKSQQRKFREKDVWTWDDLLSEKYVTLYSVDDKGSSMVLYAKDPFLKEVLSEKLREGTKPVLVRSSLTVGHLRVDGVTFWQKVLDDGTLSSQEYEKLQTRVQALFPDEGNRIKKVFSLATQGAGAANIASFALDFFSKITE